MIRTQRVDLQTHRGVHMVYREAGDGPAIVLVHGWAGSWHLWRETLVTLATSGYHVYAPDLIGCGESSKPRLLYTPHDYIVALHGFLTALDLDRVVLIGHSLGGHIALAYALSHSLRVARLVLVAPAFSPLRQLTPTPAELLLVLAGLPLIGEVAMALLPQAVIRAFLGQPWGGFYRPDRIAPDVLDGMAAAIARASPLVCNTIRHLFLFSLPVLSWLAPDADLLPYLRGVTMPTLVVWGLHDVLLKPSAFPLLVTGLPRAVGRPLADAGHSPFVEAPREFMRCLLDFLYSAESPPQGRSRP